MSGPQGQGPSPADLLRVEDSVDDLWKSNDSMDRNLRRLRLAIIALACSVVGLGSILAIQILRRIGWL